MYTPTEPKEVLQILKDVRSRSMPSESESVTILEEALSHAVKVDKDGLEASEITSKVLEKSCAMLALSANEKKTAFGIIAPQAPALYGRLASLSDDDFEQACIIENTALRRFA